MRRVLVLRNRQRVRPLNTRLLRSLALALLDDFLRVEEFELGLHLVGAVEMARVNRRFLGHEGSTDVITFNHAGTPSSFQLHGEIFISLDDAVRQAREFRTTWQSELARYLIHGLLHLRGHDDLDPARRKRMKREENRLLASLAEQFALSRLARPKRSLS